jgi:hypothetical protein
MTKAMPSNQSKGPQRQEIEFWDDDCGLSDLARDAFAHLEHGEESRKNESTDEE